MEPLMRKDVAVEETWDLSLIYKTVEDMQSDADKAKALAEGLERDYRGKLTSAKAINECLDIYREVKKLISLVVSYTDLAVSVDYYDNENLVRNDRMNNLCIDINSQLSFIKSEIIMQDESVIREAMECSKENRGYLGNLLRDKPHQLSPETEKALNALDMVFRTPYNVYNMAKLADMKFDSFFVDGKEYPLGYSLFEDDYEYEENTAVRRTAFEKFSDRIRQYENVTACAYNSLVQQEKALATLRGFDSVIDYLLFNQKVTREMYDRQIDMIMNDLAPHMRRYAGLIRKTHGLDRMTYADLKLPLDPSFAPAVTIDQCKEYVRSGLSILGDDYVSMIDQAFRERWIDFARNQGKSTGGFCSSPYGRGSFILLSYNGRMSDVFTIAHELGHAGHFRLCNGAQSIFDTDVSSYFVEAPSTMNEILMAHYLLKTNDDRRFQRWVVSNMVGNTYYHNFVTHLLEAAYQREVYRIVDAGGSLQAETLNGIMKDVLTRFWGDSVELNEGAELTWMRQPHYYLGLYSYTYSAGLTVATQVCKRIEKEGCDAVEDWKKVLTAGSTLDSMGLAKLAGIDISTSGPLADTIATIGEYIDFLEG